MRVCISCNKKLEKKHVRCRKCKYLVCHDCAVDDYCSSCHPANQDDAVIEEYFKDKYTSKNSVVKKVGAVFVTIFLLLLLLPGVSAWWDADWNYRQNFTVSADPDLTETTQFAYKVVLNSTNTNYNHFQGDGGDVRFIDTGNSTLPYFLEVFNKSGSSIFYVNITLTNSTSTVFYMYYNDSSINTTTSDFNSTFGSELQHFSSFNTDADDLSDNDNSVAFDSSDYESAFESDEVWDGRKDFNNGAPEYILFNNRFPDSNTGSLAWWFKPDEWDGGDTIFYQAITDGASGTQAIWHTNNSLRLITGASNSIYSAHAFGTGKLFYVTVTWDGSMYYWYTNGTYEGDHTSADNMFSGLSTTAIAFGASYYSAAQHGNGYDGDLDEFRFYYGKVLSAQEVLLLFDQPEFSVTSPEVLGGEEPGQEESAEACNVSIVTPCEGCRYQHNHLHMVWNCTNESWSSDYNCTYSINKFSPTYVIDDCTNFTLYAEVGLNVMNFSVYNGSGVVVGSEEVRFWTKNYDSYSFATYIVLIVMGIAYFICIILGLWTGLGLFYPLSSIPGLMFGLEIFGLNYWGGVLTILLVVGLTTSLIFSKMK